MYMKKSVFINDFYTSRFINLPNLILTMVNVLCHIVFSLFRDEVTMISVFSTRNNEITIIVVFSTQNNKITTKFTAK